jgi:hypothetical protein
MTYPQNGYPTAPPQPQYQPPAPQGYAPPVNGYPTNQYPTQQPGYPTPQPQYAPQGYGQPQYGPPQGYGQPQQQQQEYQGPPPMAGSLDAFYNQHSTGWGPSWQTGNEIPVNTVYIGRVARPLVDADVEQATKFNSTEPDFFRDGTPKMVMKIPVLVRPDQRFAEGRAQFFAKGGDRDELNRAMAAAGAQSQVPEAGSIIVLTITGKRRNNFGTSSSTIQIQYLNPGPDADQYATACGIVFDPQGASAAPPPAPAPVQQPPAQPQYQAPPMPQQYAAPQPPAPQQQFQPPAPPVPTQQFQAPPVPQQAAPQGGPAQPPAPQFDPASLPPMSPEQQNLLAGLIGQQQAQPTG